MPPLAWGAGLRSELEQFRDPLHLNADCSRRACHDLTPSRQQHAVRAPLELTAQTGALMAGDAIEQLRPRGPSEESSDGVTPSYKGRKIGSC